MDRRQLRNSPNEAPRAQPVAHAAAMTTARRDLSHACMYICVGREKEKNECARDLQVLIE